MENVILSGGLSYVLFFSVSICSAGFIMVGTEKLCGHKVKLPSVGVFVHPPLMVS
jgi:hypothetical protein